MSVPSNPSAAQLIADGLIEIGQVGLTSTSSAVTTFQTKQFQDIKTLFWGATTDDDLLDTEALMLTTAGVREVTLPTDFDHEKRVRLFDASDSNRVTLSNGFASAVVMPSTFSADPTSVLGKYLFTLSGTGSSQYDQVTTYSDSTKVATVNTGWSTTPDSTTAVMLGDFWVDLPQREILTGTALNARPNRYRLYARTMQIHPPPDAIYPILIFYGSNLTRLDETGTVFVRHIRERRALWIQGIKAKGAALYDDDRRPTEEALLNQMLRGYASKNTQVAQTARSR